MSDDLFIKIHEKYLQTSFIIIVILIDIRSFNLCLFCKQ